MSDKSIADEYNRLKSVNTDDMTAKERSAHTAALNAAEDAYLATIPSDSAVVAERDAFNIVKIPDVPAATFADAIAQYETAYGNAVEAADANNLGDGYEEVDKAELVNMPFLLQVWELDSGKNRMAGDDGASRAFLICRAITQANRRVRFTAGGEYGIASDLMRLTAERIRAGHPSPNGGLMFLKGLEANPIDGQPGKFIYRAKL